MSLSGHKFALSFFGAVLLAWVLVMFILIRNAALPPEATGTMLAVFDPKVSETEALAMIANAHAKIVKQSGLTFAWIVSAEEPGLAGRLKANGALGAYRELPIPVELAGCLAFADAKVLAKVSENH